jgi:hypothetical protein
MTAWRWWKLGLGIGPLLGTLGCAPGHVLPAPAAKEKALERGSLLHTGNWPAAPLGDAVAIHAETQIANAAAGRMVLYDYDFVPGKVELNDYGRSRVLRIAPLLTHTRLPVVVEWLPHAPGLAERRRLTVLTELAAVAGRVPPDRVVIGPSPSVPVQGPEAELIYQNLLQLTESAGTAPATGVRYGPTTGGVGSGSGTSGIGGVR